MLALNRFSQPPVQEVEPTPSVLSVASEYVQNPTGFQNMVLRPALRVLKWTDFMGGLSGIGKECKSILGNFNFAFFWLDFPSDLRKLVEAVNQLREKIFTGSFWDVTVCSKNVFVRSALATDLVVESLLIANGKNVIYFSASQLAILSTAGFLGSTALAMSALSGLQTQYDTFINSEIGSPKFKLSLIKMASKSCLVAVGVFGMVSFIAGSIIPAFILLMVSTLLLLFSLAGYFYDKLYVEPMNLSSEKTVEVKA